jgi:hypothetical protein
MGSDEEDHLVFASFARRSHRSQWALSQTDFIHRCSRFGVEKLHHWLMPRLQTTAA